MKLFRYILGAAILTGFLAGCSKDSFDPASKSRQDFEGTWTGSISTFKNNKLLKETGTVVIYPDAGGTSMAGILFMKEINLFREFQFQDGTLYFNVENHEPDNILCQNWSLGGFAVFTADDEIEIHITGNECGYQGSEFVNWVGTLRKTEIHADSLKTFHFAQTGRTWTYQVMQTNGDSCQVTRQITQTSGTHGFTGTIGNTCSWPGTIGLRWTVTPAEFTIQNDSTILQHPLRMPVNAVPGVVYRTLAGSDTLTMTLVDTLQVMSTPAGNFPCWLYRYTEPFTSGSQTETRTANIWVSSRYGIIRQEVVNGINPTDSKLQVLTAKNF